MKKMSVELANKITNAVITILDEYGIEFDNNLFASNDIEEENKNLAEQILKTKLDWKKFLLSKTNWINNYDNCGLRFEKKFAGFKIQGQSQEWTMEEAIINRDLKIKNHKKLIELIDSNIKDINLVNGYETCMTSKDVIKVLLKKLHSLDKQVL